MDSFKEFKQYFKRDFWRAFDNKPYITDLPKTYRERESLLKKTYNEIKEQRYHPSPLGRYIYANKGSGVARFKTILSVKDYCVYYYCFTKLEDKLLGHASNQNLGEKSKVAVGYQAFTRSLNELDTKLYELTKSKKYAYLIELDIANYLESISLELLEEQIRKKLHKDNVAEIVALLFVFLKGLNEKSCKPFYGLPVMQLFEDCSWVLADFYLRSYDRGLSAFCRKNGCKYVRCMDDHLIFSNDKKIFNRIIFKTSKELHPLGLSLNQKKVRISLLQDSAHFQYLKFLKLFENEKNRKEKKRVEQMIDCYFDFSDQWLTSGLYFNGRVLLNKVLSCPVLPLIDPVKKTRVMKVFLGDEYLQGSRAAYFDSIYKFLPNTDKHLLINKLNLLSQKLIHNFFHLEVLEFYQKNNIDCSHIWARIKELEKI